MNDKPVVGSSKPLGEQLRDALNLYGWHLSWCKKLAQMPMEPGRTYLWPKDDAEWRAQQPCTCKWDEVANTLVRSTDETEARRCNYCGTILVADKCPQCTALKAECAHDWRPEFGHLVCVKCAECKPFVHLCAPHGKDWLTCPECAKAAGIGGSAHD